MIQGDRPRPVLARPSSSWATMNVPARVFAVLGTVTLVVVFALLAALVVGGLAWLVQIVWSAVLA